MDLMHHFWTFLCNVTIKIVDAEIQTLTVQDKDYLVAVGNFESQWRKRGDIP